MLREHIEKEDEILYPLAEKMFTEKEKDRLLKKFQKAELKKGGEITVKKYKDMVTNLQIVKFIEVRVK